MSAIISSVTIQQLDMAGIADEAVLDRALADDRVVITSDRNTMLGIRHVRMLAGTPGPGLIVVDMTGASFRIIAEHILFVAEAAEPRDLINPIFIPLR